MPSQLVITIDRSVVEPILTTLLFYWGFCLILRILAIWVVYRAGRLKEMAELESETIGSLANPSIEQLRGIREHFRAKHSL